MQPYTYLLTHVPSGKRYYGVRYSKKANPEELWVSYFSSSRKVKALPREEFSAEVRRTFSSPQEALAWEQKVIQRLYADTREDWLNQHYSGGSFHPGPRTKEHNEKISAAQRGRKMSRAEKAKHKWTTTQRAKIVAKLTGRKLSDEHRAKLSLAHTGLEVNYPKNRKCTLRGEAFKERQRLSWIKRREKYGPTGRASGG